MKSRHVTHGAKQQRAKVRNRHRSECTGGRPEGLGPTVSSARPFWKLPTQSNSYLRSLPLGLGCPTGSRKQLPKQISTFRVARAQYREGMVEMVNALSGDWPAPFGVGAFQHVHRPPNFQRTPPPTLADHAIGFSQRICHSPFRRSHAGHATDFSVLSIVLVWFLLFLLIFA